MVPSWPVCSQISLYLIAYPVQKLSRPRLEINSRLERVINHPLIDTVEDYNVLNLTAGIDFANGAWGFDLMIFNATNEDGINSAMTDVFGVNATGIEFIPPRQVMGRISYTF